MQNYFNVIKSVFLRDSSYIYIGRKDDLYITIVQTKINKKQKIFK